MRYVAIFCHAFKQRPANKKFRLAYKIIDPQAGKYASVFQGNVRNMAEGISSNTPHCLAVSLALRDPFLDKIEPGTIICIFNNHKMIHDRIHRFLMSGRMDDPKTPFDKSVNGICRLISPTQTASAWNDIKDPSNRLANVLVDLGSFRNEEELKRQDVFCDASILRATEGAAQEMMSEYYENIMRRKNGDSIFDDLPF